MQPKPPCSERERLAEQYRTASKIYKDATASLAAVSPDQFEETYQHAEGVRMIFERARADLEEHIQQHGCEAPDQIAE